MPSKSPIHSVKHYVQIPIFTVASLARSQSDIVTVVAAPVLSRDIKEGSVIKAVYAEIWITGAVADLTAGAFILKNPSGAPVPTYAQSIALHNFDNKKNVLVTFQGIPPTGGNVMNVFKGWVKIPKGKQRFGLGDSLSLIVFGTGTAVNVCGFFVYKEYQ